MSSSNYSSISVVYLPTGYVTFTDIQPIYFNIIQAAYGIPSVLFLITLFFLFAFHNKFSNSFYRLIQIDIIVNLSCCFNSWLALRLDQHEFGIRFLLLVESLLPGSLTIFRFLCTAYFHIQNVTGYSLVLHRLTNTKCFFAETYWKRYYLLVPVFAIVYTVGVLTPWWFNGNFSCHIETNDNVLIKTFDAPATQMLHVVNPFFASFYFLLNLFTGVWTMRTVSSKSRSIGSQRFIRKLTRIAIFNAIVMSGNLVFTIVFSIFISSTPTKDFSMQSHTRVLTFTSDMYTLALPYILLGFDSNIRRFLGLKKNKKLRKCSSNQRAITFTDITTENKQIQN